MAASPSIECFDRIFAVNASQRACRARRELLIACDQFCRKGGIGNGIL
jgi:hypothetical protein